jgi:3-phenylpropionate/trans-cinnamate dioxygenase ferredoxin subunit
LALPRGKAASGIYVLFINVSPLIQKPRLPSMRAMPGARNRKTAVLLRTTVVELASPRLSPQPNRLELLTMFIKIGHAKDVAAGEMRVFYVAGTKVNVANADGQLYAFDDTCTHMGCSLANGELEGTMVTCACHGSQFDVTSGAVLRGPAERPVRSHALQVDGEDLLAEA